MLTAIESMKRDNAFMRKKIKFLRGVIRSLLRDAGMHQAREEVFKHYRSEVLKRISPEEAKGIDDAVYEFQVVRRIK